MQELLRQLVVLVEMDQTDKQEQLEVEQIKQRPEAEAGVGKKPGRKRGG